jgi:hypothetical protein
MNDLLFMVADTNMREALSGFLERQAVHQIIGCRAIDFDARRDIKVAKGQNDPGLFTRANELLRPFSRAYCHAVVVVDEEWDGSPGAAVIQSQLDGHLTDVGWGPPDGLSLVVQPEVDNWLWSESPHSATALGWRSWEELRPALQRNGWLEGEASKPARPREAAEWALRHGAGNAKRSASLYRKVAGSVSVRRCVDPAVDVLLNALRRWFPAEGA